MIHTQFMVFSNVSLSVGPPVWSRHSWSPEINQAMNHSLKNFSLVGKKPPTTFKCYPLLFTGSSAIFHMFTCRWSFSDQIPQRIWKTWDSTVVVEEGNLRVQSGWGRNRGVDDGEGEMIGYKIQGWGWSARDGDVEWTISKTSSCLLLGRTSTSSTVLVSAARASWVQRGTACARESLRLFMQYLS